MTTPRRRLVRPEPAPPLDPRRQRRNQQLHADLEKERAALARWLTRLRRACNALQKSQGRVARIEKRLAREEE